MLVVIQMNGKFKDRLDAAKKLSLALKKYDGKEVLVLAIPKGGVEIGYELARFLHAGFSLVITRKLPLPRNPEAGFGAVSEDGSSFIFQDLSLILDNDIVDKIKEEQKKEIERRKLVLRKNKPLPSMKDKIIIITDDGIAMGSTMKATIKLCKKRNPKKIVVASPVSSPEVKKEIDRDVDETVVLITPNDFRAVAQVYQNWYDVSDKEVISIMDEWNRNHASV